MKAAEETAFIPVVMVTALHDQLRSRNEELRKLQEMRESLTQLIVHDMRNLLAASLASLDFAAPAAGLRVPAAG